MLVRLEAELLRLLRNPSALKLEMQPMTGYNASLVEAVAQYFELGFSFIDAEPGDVTASASVPADQCPKSSLRTVTLRKLEDSKVPLLRLEELLPAPGARAVGTRGGAMPGKKGDAGSGEGVNPPRVESSDSFDSGKVQLMRRAKAQSQDKAPEPARLSAKEVETRLRDKEAEYEAARRRIMGEDSDVAAGAAANEASGVAQPATGQLQGPGEVLAGDGGQSVANGAAAADRGSSAAAALTVAQSGGSGRACGRVTTAVGKAAGRAQDRNDPDYDRSRILRQGGGRGAVAPAPCCMGGTGSMDAAGRPAMGMLNPSGVSEIGRLHLGVTAGYASPGPAGNPGMGYGVAGAYSICGAGCGPPYAPTQMSCCALPRLGAQPGYGEFGTLHAPPSHLQPPFHHAPQQHQVPAHFSSMADALGGLGGCGCLWPVAAGCFSAVYSAPAVGAAQGGHAVACASGGVGYGALVSAAACNAHHTGYVGGPLCGSSHFGAPGLETSAPAAPPGVRMQCAALPGPPHPPPPMAGAGWSAVMLPGAHAPVPGHTGSLPGAILPGFAVPVPPPNPLGSRCGGGGAPCAGAPPPAAAASNAQVWQPPLPSGPPPQRT